MITPVNKPAGADKKMSRIMLSSSVAVMPRTPCGAAGLRLLVLAFCGHDLSAALQTPDRPNILFIAIDDLNDWVEPLSGHPQSLTPNLSAFADDSVNFTRNYCTSPGCNPSRSTLMTGYHTYTSGMYSNYQDWRKVPRLAQATTLGEYFRDNGYYSAGAGKIYHYSQVAPRTWDDYFPSQTNNMPEEFIPENNPVNMPEFKYMYRMFDWDALSFDDTETADYKSVSYINTQLEMSHSKPFFLAAGIYRPHLPWYVPKKYFDLFPLDQIRLPEVFADDTTDLGGRATELIGRGGGYHAHVLKAGKWQEAIQGYLASIAFADAMVGQLLEALENSRYAKKHHCRHLVGSWLAVGRERALEKVRAVGKPDKNCADGQSARRRREHAGGFSKGQGGHRSDLAAGHLSDAC